MDPVAVADYVVPASGEGREEPFLLARLVCDQLIARPVDTTQLGWEAQVAGSVFEALDVEIDAASAPPNRDLSQSDAAAFARQLLAALTWGFGAGLPETEWIAVATALCVDLDVAELGVADISWVLDQLGRYILLDGEAGQAVYRMAHQSLADYLRPAFVSSAAELFDPRATPVTAALLGLYEGQLTAGLAATDPAYLWRYAWRHATLSGLDGLALLRAVAALTGDLDWDIATACMSVSDVLASWGRHVEALPPAEEAVQLYLGLAADNPGYLPNLAGALNNLGIRLAAVGRRGDALAPTEEAVQLYRALAADNPGYLPNLAAALGNLGVRLGELGRRDDALAPTEEAVELYRVVSDDNPGYLPDLAAALNNLGGTLGYLGRRGDALPPVEEAARLRRALAADNPGYLPDLARALNNLGTSLAELGRRGDALPPIEEAVRLRRILAADNPGYLPDLASALNNLGTSLAALGRPGEALPAAEEAVQLYRELAADNPGYLPNLAVALTNLGNRLAELGLGRPGDALPPTEEAVQLSRELAADNPGYLPDLAGALNNLGNRLAALGRRGDALPPTEQAVQLYRGLAADNPGYLPNLAGALNNLGIRLTALGRRGDALPPTEEAVQLRRALAADNPGYLPDLAGALNNLGNQLAALGRRGDALPPTEQAVQLYRGLAADNPGYLPNLAGALNNLGIRLTAVGRRGDALAPTEEAVQLYRALAADNPGYLPDLAGALNNLGNRLAALGRPGDALTSVEEAARLYRALAADNPGYLPDLAGALNNLGNRLAALGRPGDALAPTGEAVQLYRALAADNPGYLRDLAAATSLLGQLRGEREQSGAADAVWEEVLAAFPPDARATLLLHRAYRFDDDPAAAGWLAEADSLAADDQRLTSAIHDETRQRRHRALLEFDAAWSAATGSPIPDWGTVDPQLVSTVREWINTPTYSDEHAFLHAHPELLRSQADLAVHEGLLGLTEAASERYLGLRAEAQTVGVGAAYRDLVLSELAAEFMDADPARQRQLLVSRRADLLDEMVVEAIRGWAAEDETGQAAAALSLLTLADTEPLSYIAEMLDSVDNPDRFTDLLQRTAVAGRAVPLTESATYGLYAATTGTGAASCLFFLAVAAILDQDADTAAQYLAAARNADPNARDTWIGLTGQIGAHQPEVLKLIPILTSPLPHTEDDT